MDYGTHLKATVPNPSRRSAHHTRQSRFEVSDRQLRGALLRELTARPGQNATELADATGFDPLRVEGILAALRAEGFLSEEDGCFGVG